MGYKRQKHILETDTESMFIYSSLLKNETIGEIMDNIILQKNMN